jgi:hypothetical protein
MLSYYQYLKKGLLSIGLDISSSTCLTNLYNDSSFSAVRVIMSIVMQQMDLQMWKA